MNQHQMQSRLTNMQLQQEETLKALSNKEREVMQLKETALKQGDKKNQHKWKSAYIMLVVARC